MTAGLACDLASVLVALDFDGTLAPITPHPEDARPLAGVHQVLRDVRATGAALAVVTGRSVSSLLRVSGFGAIPGIVIYGTHGAERWQAGSLRTAAAPPGLEELRETLPGLVAGIVRDPDVWVEDKRLSLVVHARLTAQPERVLDRLREPVEEAAAAAGLGMRPGREVLEICLPGIDKGTAVRELLEEDRAAVLYAGDDVGDLDAMVEVNAWAERVGRPGLTVAVGAAGGPVAGVADVTVPDPAGLLDLLRRLLLAAFAVGSSGFAVGLQRFPLWALAVSLWSLAVGASGGGVAIRARIVALIAWSTTVVTSALVRSGRSFHWVSMRTRASLTWGEGIICRAGAGWPREAHSAS